MGGCPRGYGGFCLVSRCSGLFFGVGAAPRRPPARGMPPPSPPMPAATPFPSPQAASAGAGGVGGLRLRRRRHRRHPRAGGQAFAAGGIGGAGQPLRCWCLGAVFSFSGRTHLPRCCCRCRALFCRSPPPSRFALGGDI